MSILSSSHAQRGKNSNASVSLSSPGSVDDAKQIVDVIAIRHRSDAYK